MTLSIVRHTLALIALPALVVVVAGCKGDAEMQTFTFGPSEGGVEGCSQPGFPAEQPDMSPFAPPEFVTETGEQQRLIRPGDPLMAEITVNAATRRVLVEIANVSAPEIVTVAEEIETLGDRTIPLFLFSSPDNRGRFYMRITLCGSSCNAQEVVFDLAEFDPDMQETTGINADYDRTLIENGEVIQVDETCIRPNSILIQ